MSAPHTVVADDDGVVRVLGKDGRHIADINLFDHGVDEGATIDVIAPDDAPVSIEALVMRFRTELPEPVYTANERGTHHTLTSPSGLVAVLVKPAPVPARPSRRRGSR